MMRLWPILIILVLGVAAAALTTNVDAASARALLMVAVVIATLVGGARAASLETLLQPVAATERTASEIEDAVVSLGRDRRNPIIDRPTGLYTDWYFRLRLEDEIQRAARFGQRFAVVFVPTGPARTNLALALQRRLRQVDYAADLGDAIAVVLPNTHAENARKWQRRFDSIISAEVRIAEYPRDGDTVSVLLGEDTWDISKFGRSAA